MRRSVIIFIFLFFFLSSLIGGSVFSTYEFFLSEGPLAERKEILIKEGETLKQIANKLKKEGFIDSPSIFVFGVRANGKGKSLRTGEYSIPARSSPKMIMDILTGGQTHIRRITFQEGMTSYQIVQQLNETDNLIGTIDDIPKNGTLLPETYYYSYGDTRQSIIDRMQNAMNRAVDFAWQQRVIDFPLTKEEAVILASIVEKETSILAEANHIASVFLNRLKKNMRLQSDTTVIYALSNGTGVLNRKLWTNDLKVKHPYNTYVIYGLPPSAISNPGAGTLQAVMTPFESQDLYFVADGTGGHIFAKTYEEHIQNVKEWRRLKTDKKARQEKRNVKKIQNVPVPPSIPISLQKASN